MAKTKRKNTNDLVNKTNLDGWREELRGGRIQEQYWHTVICIESACNFIIITLKEQVVVYQRHTVPLRPWEIDTPWKKLAVEAGNRKRGIRSYYSNTKQTRKRWWWIPYSEDVKTERRACMNRKSARPQFQTAGKSGRLKINDWTLSKRDGRWNPSVSRRAKWQTNTMHHNERYRGQGCAGRNKEKNQPEENTIS